jgi:hypothetical protein
MRQSAQLVLFVSLTFFTGAAHAVDRGQFENAPGLRAPTQYVGSVPLLVGHSIPNARLRASVDLSFGDTTRRRQFIASLVTAKAFNHRWSDAFIELVGKMR